MASAPDRILGWRPPVTLLAVALVFSAAPVRADPLVEQETRAALARSMHGVSGKGVAVAVLDRGIDWSHADFRNADGSTRIAYIYDLTDATGANAANNRYGAGTIYTRAQIDAALAGGAALATRDAVGHGTATAGNCCGNGRASQGKYTGIAPEATLIIVKFTSDGAPAHDNQPAEAAFYNPALFSKAVDFAVDKAKELGMPLVMLANFGSIFDRADGGDAIAKKIDATVGPGKKGLVFVTGAGDDGGRNNHASGQVAAGSTTRLQFRKGQAGNVNVVLWYAAADRFAASVTTPTATYGPIAAPANATFDRQTTPEFTYNHYGSVYNDGSKRSIYLTLTGPVGDYSLDLSSSAASTEAFEAYITPGFYSANDANRFLSHLQAGKTIWSGATARYNIAPNSYVFRQSWSGINGGNYSITTEGALGDLWQGSSIGPTWDGRIGVDLSAPGDRNITTYAPNSYWATARGNLISDGQGLYGMAGAVSAAAPLVTGAVALMLQANPSADASAIKSALQRSARADAFTGAVPNPRWGHGKLDVLAAVAATPLPVVPNSVSNCLFNWAERSFPQFFSPAGVASGTAAPYYYRYYPATQNYLAISSADNYIWLLGPVSGGVPLAFARLRDYLGQAGCPG